VARRNNPSIQRAPQQDKALLRQIQGTLTPALDAAIRSRFREWLKEAPYA
jgi:hypothetical protein